MSSVPPSHQLGCLRILIVDKHIDTQEALRGYLAHTGHQVTVASPYAEATKWLAQHKCDVALICLERDRRELDLLKETADSFGVISVAMSSHRLDGEQLGSARSGFRYHLLKPFDPDALDKILANIMRDRLRSAPIPLPDAAPPVPPFPPWPPDALRADAA